MLQEESCKRLAKLLHTSFSKAYFIEFASRLDMDIAPKRLKDLENIEVSNKQKLADRVISHFEDNVRNRNI